MLRGPGRVWGEKAGKSQIVYFFSQDRARARPPLRTFDVDPLGFRVLDLRFRVEGLGFKV